MISQKWYASYTGVGEFTLLSTFMRDEALRDLDPDGDVGAERDQINQLCEFETLAEAKQYIRGGISADQDACRGGRRLLARTILKTR